MICNGPKLTIFASCVFELLCDTWVMNKSRLYSNERDPEDNIVKKDLKELKVTSYINNVHRFSVAQL